MMARSFPLISRLILFVLLASFFAGCSPTSNPNYAKIGLVEISGKVTLDGEPLADAAIFFHDKPNRRYSFGYTDSQGRYQLMFDSRKSGVIPGEKVVEITTLKNPMGSPGSSEEGDDDSGTTAKTERVPAKYNSQSTLTFNVTENASNVDFDLSSSSE